VRSEKHIVRFELVAWTLSPVLAVILYVITWPPTDMLCRRTGTYTTMSSGRPSSGSILIRPSWLITFYWPLDVLRDANGKGNVLERYYEWWRVVLKR
jgi:hypothetical protein